jgi:hypothetical protein
MSEGTQSAKNEVAKDWRAEAADSDERAAAAASSFYETVEIQLLPGGRVRMDSPQDPFIFEVQFHPLTRRRQRKPPRTGASWNIFGGDITQVSFLARPRERIDPIPLFDTGLAFAYFWALKHYLDALDSESPWLRLPRRDLPQQGKRTDPAFYAELLALNEQLKLRGSTRPAADLAEQLGVNPNTVRSWLMRARQMKEQK